MTKKTIRTSFKWCQELGINPADIIDPDGWDRSSDDNFWYDFNQKMISKLMFDHKIRNSSCTGTALEYYMKLTKIKIENYKENKNETSKYN